MSTGPTVIIVTQVIAEQPRRTVEGKFLFSRQQTNIESLCG